MAVIGRGAQSRPPVRFEEIRFEENLEDFEGDETFEESRRRIPTRYYPDESETIVSKNESPDLPFRYSINPYRGCAHGCSYCYARPTHEYLGLDAGLDFESKILVKQQAPELFRKHLARSNWRSEPIVFSGVTDCYQPAERQFQLTRRCIEVALEARQPISIVTKNALVVRDLDLLKELAVRNLVHVAISMTSCDQALTRKMEPRTSSPSAKLEAIRQLSENKVPVQVMFAPVIPGLNDHEMAAILSAAKKAGAVSAEYLLLRLPLTVLPVFQQWLRGTFPHRYRRVIHAIESVRAGKLNDAEFGRRMRGQGERADQIQKAFHLFRDRMQLGKSLPPLSVDQFRRPGNSGQQFLF